MKIFSNAVQAVAAAAVAAIACTAPLSAHAQATGEEWRFHAILYGWLPDIGGTTYFPTTGGGPSVEVDASTLLDNLKFAFMGMFEARMGQWGVFVDYDYMDVSASKVNTRDFAFRGYPVGSVTGDFNYDLKGNVLTLTGVYGISQAPQAQADLVFGARMLKLDQTLGWTFNGNLGAVPLQTRTGSSDAGLTNWDAIVGVKGRVNFGEGLKWFVPYYADIGAGQSQLTWQAMAGLGYSFEWGDIVAAWRYLDYNFKSDLTLQSLTMNGPAVGIAFRW